MTRWMLPLLLLTTSLHPAGAAPSADDGLMVDSIDTSVDPCKDFYHFACNGWLKANPVPADQSAWDIGSVLVEHNNDRLRAILDHAAETPTPETQRIGDYWSACMDEAAIDKRGIGVLRPELDAIDAITDKTDLATELGHLHRIGIDALFSFGVQQDYRNATESILTLDQGGLGLPDRSYYEKTDKDSLDIRSQYEAHLARIAVLAGADPEQAKLDAARLLKIELVLAKASLSDEERVDPKATYHRLKRPVLDKLAPDFDWDAYLKSVKSPPLDVANIAVPRFVEAVQTLVSGSPLDEMKAYLRLKLIEHAAEMLPAPLVQEDFDFYGRTLGGAKQIKPRWKRCVANADRDIGEAIGQLYVKEVFGSQSRDAITQMVGRIRTAFADDLKTIPWMGTETRARALKKLDAMVNKIGYPDKWRDYSGLEIKRDDALGNMFRSDSFELDRQFGKIGKPVDRGEWLMTPSTVNAYYDDQRNDINFPAGTLQKPYFDLAWDDAINYGSIGSTIGHEMTHGFDNAGRMFDAAGDLKNWWTAKDAKNFETRAACLVSEYSGFEAAPGVNLNGEVTLGENTADNGGTRLAYTAFETAIAGKHIGQIDGYTPEQRFFLAYAQSWCENQSETAARLQAQTDPHSTAEFRVNGVVRNMTEFREAFACHEGETLAPTKICKVW